MKKLLLSVLSYLLILTTSFAQEDSLTNKANSFFRSKLYKKGNLYTPIKTEYYDTIQVKDLFYIDTSGLNRINLFSKIVDSKKFLSVTNNFTIRIQKRINKNLVDKQVISFYDTLNPNYSKINLVDSSIKFNKEIINDEGLSFKIYHSFTYKNRDNINIIDTAIIFYTPKPIRMVSSAICYKEGFNFLGTMKINRDIIKEEQEIFINEYKRNRN